LYRALRYVDVEQLERQIAEHGQALDEEDQVSGRVEGLTGELLWGQAVDGKAVRGASKHGDQVFLVSLVRHESGIVLGQREVEHKTNEITVVPQLLAGHNLHGTVTTMDALLTHRPLASQIINQQGDYLMIVKGNQPETWAAIDLLFQSPPLPQGEDDRLLYTSTNKGHGRIETRTLVSSTLLNQYLDWPGACQVLQRTCKRVNVNTGEISEEITYGITSLSRQRVLLPHIEAFWRGHWTIENRNHYVRDETMGEDRCQVHTGSAAHALAALRNGILNTLRYQGWENIAEALRHYGASVSKALALIGATAI
jgi:predicted transposase YbfD/YdcC